MKLGDIYGKMCQSETVFHSHYSRLSLFLVPWPHPSTKEKKAGRRTIQGGDRYQVYGIATTAFVGRGKWKLRKGERGKVAFFNTVC